MSQRGGRKNGLFREQIGPKIGEGSTWANSIESDLFSEKPSCKVGTDSSIQLTRYYNNDSVMQVQRRRKRKRGAKQSGESVILIR